MKSLLAVFFSRYRWCRRWYGGKWAYVFIDYPVSGYCWLTVPDNAGEDYREGLWRGTPVF